MSGVPASLTSAIASSPSRATMRARSASRRVIVVAAHRHLGADMREELGGNPRILGQNPVGAAKRVGGARAQIAKIADRSRDDVQAGRETVIHRLD